MRDDGPDAPVAPPGLRRLFTRRPRVRGCPARPSEDGGFDVMVEFCCFSASCRSRSAIRFACSSSCLRRRSFSSRSRSISCAARSRVSGVGLSPRDRFFRPRDIAESVRNRYKKYKYKSAPSVRGPELLPVVSGPSSPSHKNEDDRLVGMWESRVLCEISKSLWKPLWGFHRDVISTAVFAGAAVSEAEIRVRPYPCRPAGRRSWRLLRGRL